MLDCEIRKRFCCYYSLSW